MRNGGITVAIRERTLDMALGSNGRPDVSFMTGASHQTCNVKKLSRRWSRG